MLCFENEAKFGEICTNRCHDHQDCNHKKLQSYRRIPFLVEAVDRLVSEIRPDNIGGIPTIAYHQYAIAPQAIENGFSEELSPARDPITLKKKPTFYNSLTGATNDTGITTANPDDLRLSRVLKHVLDNRPAKTRIKDV